MASIGPCGNLDATVTAVRARLTRPPAARCTSSAEPARGAVTVDMLTTSAVIEVARTVSRDGCVGLGGHKVLLGSTLVGQRVTVRFEGILMHIVANGRLVKTLPAPLPPDQRTALRGARPTSQPLPPPAPHRAMRRVAANDTVTVAGQRLGIGRSYQGQTVAVAIEDTVLRVLIDGQRDLYPRTKDRRRHHHLQGLSRRHNI